MAVKERSQIKGTDAQIKAFAGHNGVLAFATDTKSLHVLSGTAGTTTEFLPSTKVATKTELDGKLSTSGGTMTGTLVMAQGKNSIDGGVADGSVQINAYGNFGGGQLRLLGKNATESKGGFRLLANNGTREVGLFGEADGSLTWDGKPVLFGESGGFPVGFLALYAGSAVPDGWFRCDGSTIADMATNYPKLYAVLGTNVLPNYSGRVPLGASSGINTTVEAGLPGAVGSVGFRPMNPNNYETILDPTGVFSRSVGEASGNANVVSEGYIAGSKDQILHLDLSVASPIYGASTTVQPPAIKVAVLIRHD